MSRKSWQIIFSGVGGQGLLLCGSTLGSAAAIYEGKNACMTADYGSEARGAFTKADCIVSTEAIAYPEVLKPDIIVALAQTAYDRYAGDAGENTVLLYNSDQVKESFSRARQIGLPMDGIAAVDNKRGPINMVSLGILVAATGIVEAGSVEKAIAERFRGKDKIIASNLTAFRKGVDAAKEITI